MSTPNHKTGTCVNGPLDGDRHTGDASKGFVLLDDTFHRVWVYDWKQVGYVGRYAGAVDADSLRQAQADPKRQVRIQ